MTNTPDVSRDIFDITKNYLGRMYQQGKELFDWDINASEKEIISSSMRMFLDLLAQGEDACVLAMESVGSTVKSLQCRATASSNNFTLRHGTAIVGGVPVFTQDFPNNTFTYYVESGSAVNYIVKGTVSARTEISAGVTYDIQDSEKNFFDAHGLDSSAPCRFMVTSGALSGSVFAVASRQNNTTFRVSGNLASLVANDTYILLPPKLTTPSGGPKTDDIHLVVWLEDISSEEDTDLLDSSLGTDIEPSHRREVRWCVFANHPEAGSEDNSIESMFDTTTFKLVQLGETTRADGVAIVSSFTDHSVINNAVSSQRVLTQWRDNFNSIQNLRDVELVLPMLAPELRVNDDVYDLNTSNIILPFRGAYSNTEFIVENTLDSGSSGQGTSQDVTNVIDVTDGTISIITDANPSADQRSLVTGKWDASSFFIRGRVQVEVPHILGMDWITTFSGGSDAKLIIDPGEIVFNNAIFQNSLATGFEINSSLSWVQGLPSSTQNNNNFYYVYAYLQDANDLRTIGFCVDSTCPLYDGSHPRPDLIVTKFTSAVTATGKAYCIGLIYYNAENTKFFRGVKRGDTIHFDDYNTAVNNYQGVPVFYGSSGEAAYQTSTSDIAYNLQSGSVDGRSAHVPYGVCEFGLKYFTYIVDAILGVTTPLIEYRLREGGTIRWRRGIEAYMLIDGLGGRQAIYSGEMVMPGSCSDELAYNFTPNNATTTCTFGAFIPWVRMSPRLNMPNKSRWTA